jgi:ligand-binding sensor domain-containing protein
VKKNAHTFFGFLEVRMPSAQGIFMQSVLVFVFAIFVFKTTTFTQNTPHPSFRQYTTNDGLASPETYHVLQDKLGYIWIATDNGISRFDGYEFHNYGFQEGLKENVIFLMQFDRLGRLWAQAKSGNLYYFEDQIFHPYQYNVLLNDFPGRPQNGRGFIVEGAGETVHISTLKYGIISIHGKGQVKVYTHDEPVYHQVFTKNGITIYSKFIADQDTQEAYRKSHVLTQDNYYPTYFYNNDEIWAFHDLDNSQVQRYNAPALSIGNGKYLFQVYEDVWLIENGEVKWSTKLSTKIHDAYLDDDGQLSLGLYGHKGLGVYNSLENFRDGKGFVQLQGKTINDFTQDSEKGRWYATHEDGLFYVSSEAFAVYDFEIGLSDDKITALAAGNQRTVYLGLENGEVWSLNEKDNAPKKLPDVPGTGAIKDLVYDFKNKELWAARYQLYFLRDNEWHLLLSQNSKQSIKAYRISKSPDQNRFWVGNFESALNLDLDAKVIDTIYLDPDQQCHSIRQAYDHRVWVGRADGLFEWQKDTLMAQQYLNPNFSLRIEDIALMPDSTLVVATKGGGLVLWKDEQIEQITTKEGLTADMLECVFADNEGNVWVGTLNGMNRISGNFGNRKVEQITISHGLPSNEINRICQSGDAIWVATNKGLVKYEERKLSSFSPEPILSSVMANGNEIDMKNRISLTADQNNLSIDFFTINYKMNGKILYRFRMNNGEWTKTDTRSVNFPSLPSDLYMFEVQSQNENRTWSESATLPFEIKPPWWNRWWAKSLGIMTSLLIVFGIYKYRTGRIKKDAKIQIQMVELERSALQAQMNPHFIFNCLNSIQNFILQNEKEAAILYLGRFSSLVRSVLNASVSGKVTLADEIKLLNTYMDLEKLRFKSRFDFEVSVGDDLDIHEYQIPPLLIQPYVENAILHGVSKKAIGGKVTVHFEKKEGFVQVTIEDNGSGYEVDGIDKKQRNKKSLGMSITKSRLELFSTGKENNLVTTKILYDAFDKISGTQIIVQIGMAE